MQFVNLYEQTASGYLIGCKTEMDVADLIYSAG